MKKLIGVIGGRSINCSSRALELAYEVGRLIAEHGYGLVCGGEDGIMESACRGCKDGGGETFGVLKWNHTLDANEYVDYAIPTSMDLARANIIIWMSSGIIAFDGGFGTATEIGIAMDVGRPIVVTGDKCFYRDELFAKANSYRIKGNDSDYAEDILDTLFLLIDKADVVRDSRKVAL